MRIRWQDDAINDLIQVRRFIAMDNPSAAARVANRIRCAVPELADQPGIGKPGRIPGTLEECRPIFPTSLPNSAEGNSHSD